MLFQLSRLSDGLLGAADVLFTAARVTGAVDRGVRPDPRDLDRLGIAPETFPRLG